jgi:hypothetical protein
MKNAPHASRTRHEQHLERPGRPTRPPEPSQGSPETQDEAPAPDAPAAPRTNTPDRRNDDGSTTITMKRACNGCAVELGDVTDAEVNRAVAGLPLLDARAECANCRLLVELEAAGCKTWEITPRSISRVDSDVDRLGVYAKGYWQEVDGKLAVVGLRIGTGETRVVAKFGDWLIRHPDGTFTVHTAPAAVTA